MAPPLAPDPGIVNGARRVVDSPIGPLVLVAAAPGRLTGVHLPATVGWEGGADAGSGPGTAAWTAATPDGDEGSGTGPARAVLEEATMQLGQYFEGRRTVFTVPVSTGGTPFQRRVWDELRRVAYGTTVSYGELARQAGRPGSARAVGHANARNPLALIVPCHRVVGASGALTGYGGGIDAKRFLIELEAEAVRAGPS